MKMFQFMFKASSCDVLVVMSDDAESAWARMKKAGYEPDTTELIGEHNENEILFFSVG